MVKNKVVIIIILVIALLIIINSVIILFASEKKMIFEKKEIISLNIRQIDKVPVELDITGIIFHSSLGIYKIDTLQYGDILQLKIYLTLASSKFSGNLSYHLVIPDTVNKVILGKEQEIIWVRDSNK